MGQAACNFTLLCNLKHSADGKKPASTATHRSIREKTRRSTEIVVAPEPAQAQFRCLAGKRELP